MNDSKLVPSFRFPNHIPSEAGHPTVVRALRDSYRAFTDIYSAFPVLKQQMDETTATVNSIKSTGTTFSPTSSSAPVSAAASGLGGINNQSAQVAYATTTQDNGTLVRFNDASAVAVSLNSGINAPYIIYLANYGAGTVTVTPTTGTINGAATLALATNASAMASFDGTNWWALVAGASSSGTSYLKGTVTFNVTSTSGTFYASTNITGVTAGMLASIDIGLYLVDGVFGSSYQAQAFASTSGTGFPGGDNVFAALTVSGLSGATGSVTLPVVVFP